jgi:hypothetical protein
LVVSIIIADSVVVLADPHSREGINLVALVITAAIALSLGILVIYRYKFHGIQGKLFLFLTLGVFFWFTAEITVSYYYFILLIRDVPPPVSLADVFWSGGYVFFALHLFMTLKSIKSLINTTVVIGVSVVSAMFVFIIIAVHVPVFVSEIAHHDYSEFVVNISYPIADVILIVPAVAILVALRKNYEHSIPWILASISLLVNALADYGFVRDVLNNKMENVWIWDLFFIADFLIIAAALYWYNRYFVTRKLEKRKSTT